jgi:hypothetical protein
MVQATIGCETRVFVIIGFREGLNCSGVEIHEVKAKSPADP